MSGLWNNLCSASAEGFEFEELLVAVAGLLIFVMTSSFACWQGIGIGSVAAGPYFAQDRTSFDMLQLLAKLHNLKVEADRAQRYR